MESVSRAQLQSLIDKGDLPVVIDFWAPWCGPCKVFTPAFEATSVAMGERAHFVKVNADDETDLLRDFGVRGVPTCLILEKGVEIMRHTGTMNEEALSAFVDRAISHA